MHTANLTEQTIADAGFSLLTHPLYSPDLTPNDYYMFRHLKKYLRGVLFQTRDDLINVSTISLKQPLRN